MLKPCLLALCALLQAPPLARAQEALQIAVEDDAAPWSMKDGSGFANDVVRAAYQAVGMDVSFTVVPYDRCKDMAVKGEACACMSMSWMQAFEGKLQFSAKPLFVCNSGYFSGAKKAPKGKAKPGGLVGVVKGYEYPPAVYQLEKDGAFRLDAAESEEANLRRVAAGELEAAIVNYNDTKPYELVLFRAGVKGRVRRAFNCGILKSHIGFSLSHPQGPMALEKFNQGYALISGDRRLRKIEKKWIKEAFDHIK